MSRKSIYDEIDTERDYQVSRWGDLADDTLNNPWHWTAYITQYAGKWMIGTWVPLGTYTVNRFRKRMIQVAAIAIAAVESIDRQREKNGATFYE